MFFFFSSRRRHTSFSRDWSSDVCSSDLSGQQPLAPGDLRLGYAFERIAQLPLPEPPPQRFAEHVMQQSVNVACLGLTADDLAGLTHAQRRPYHLPCVLLSHIVDLQGTDRRLNATLPHPILLGGRAGPVVDRYHFLAVAVPEV